jgi:hypothetical protein
MPGARRSRGAEPRASELLTEARDQRNDDGEHESSLFDAERNFNERTASAFLVGTGCLDASA